MGTLTLTDPVNGTNADASVIASNDAAIKAVVNGGLDNTNISASAGIVRSKIAGPVTALATATPAGTVSTSMVMAGIGATITPTASGVLLVSIDGDTANNTTSDGGSYQLAWGTGAAPVNGAAATGTVVGSAPRILFAAGGDSVPFSITRRITGLSANTTYWLDLQFEAITGGTFTVNRVTLTAVEL